MIDYILEIRCTPDLEELVQARLLLSRSSGNSSSDGLIRAYFDAAEDRDAAAGLLRGLAVELRAFESERTDWLKEYQQSLKPILIGRSFVVAPDPSLIPPAANRHTLVIPQGHAFGTGSHESTALAIELLEEVVIGGKRCLDIGAGSGILALAMCRLGARTVIAFDIDLDAYAALRDNRIHNRCNVEVFIGTIAAIRKTGFDVITMNILPEVIVPMLPQVVPHMRGVLIVSGILGSQRDEIMATARELRLIDEKSKGEWWAGSFATGG